MPVTKRVRQKFVGYDTTRAETDILAFQQTDGGVGLILHENPFYAESGGQVSDTGEVRGAGWVLPVAEVRKIEGKTAVFGPHEGPFEPTPVEAVVNEPLRRDTERNHTATHLLHAALRKVLGEHVRQAGLGRLARAPAVRLHAPPAHRARRSSPRSRRR